MVSDPLNMMAEGPYHLVCASIHHNYCGPGTLHDQAIGTSVQVTYISDENMLKACQLILVRSIAMSQADAQCNGGSDLASDADGTDSEHAAKDGAP